MLLSGSANQANDGQDASQSGSLLECETVLAIGNGELHEGQISLSHGYVPHAPVASLPAESGFAKFEELAVQFPQIMVTATERERIAELPLLDSTAIAELPDKYLARLSAILGNASHLYYYNLRQGHTQEADPLPVNLRKPWEQLCARIGRKLVAYEPGKLSATRGHYDAFFNAWEIDDPSLLDGVRNGEVTLDNLSLSMPVFGNNEERVFVLSIVLMELRFAVALPHIFKAIKAVAAENDEALIEALKNIVKVVESVTDALDYLSGNEHSKHYVDPTLWSKTIAKFDGEIPGGLRGLSASVFPLFHTLDSLIERRDHDTLLGKALVEKFEAQPPHIRNFISAMRRDIAKHSLRDYIERSNNPLLKRQYQSLMDVYLGEYGITKIHSDKAAAYVLINFRTGRLETNGKKRATATTETQQHRVIVNDFADADAERKKNYVPHPHYATRVGLTQLGDTATEVVLDVSQSGIDFSPGDHCAVLPMNYQDEIDSIVEKYLIDPELEIPVNAEWKKFIFNRLGMDVDVIQMRLLLNYADFSKSDQWKLNPVDLNSISPLSQRFYSVSPLTTPGQVRLTVASHYHVGDMGQPTPGKASGYLVHPMSTTLHIDKVSARAFHLPSNPETPVVMFAAGTGISPFMGFIDARKGQANALTWLFLGTTHRSAFYYADELKQAVRDGDLKLDVIFSREADVDTAEFDKEANDFVFKKKYQGRHVDALIKSQEEQLAELIINGAHIYVCGSNGFGDTVRNGIKLALLAHMTEAEADKYLLSLQADRRYHVDVFTPSHQLQQLDARPIYLSEVASHNKMDDCWAAINGNVYDLTRFSLVHPGGRKIIHLNAGTDFSIDYNHIGHNLNPVIQARLAHMQVGPLVTPDFTTKKAATVYNTAFQYLHALLEAQNTLVNSTTFIHQEKPAYLWREVFNVFVQGHLQAYDPKGSSGSFTYVFSKLLSELVVSIGLPEDRFDDVYRQLFALANRSADIIRNSTLEHNLKKIQKIEIIFKHFLDETLKFTEAMKLLVIKFINKLETTGEFDAELDAGLINDLINGNEDAMRDYLESLTRIDAVLHLDGSAIQHPFVPAMLTGGVCPFMPTASRKISAAAEEPVKPVEEKQPSSSASTVLDFLPSFARSAITFFASLNARPTQASHKVDGESATLPQHNNLLN